MTTTAERRRQDDEEMEWFMGEIGGKLRDAIDHLRNEAHELSEMAKDADAAWRAREWGWLAERRFITSREADFMANIGTDEERMGDPAGDD